MRARGRCLDVEWSVGKARLLWAHLGGHVAGAITLPSGKFGGRVTPLFTSIANEYFCYYGSIKLLLQLSSLPTPSSYLLVILSNRISHAPQNLLAFLNVNGVFQTKAIGLQKFHEAAESGSLCSLLGSDGFVVGFGIGRHIFEKDEGVDVCVCPEASTQTRCKTMLSAMWVAGECYISDGVKKEITCENSVWSNLQYPALSTNIRSMEIFDAQTYHVK